MKNASTTPNTWLVYIIECDNNTLYTGITTDMGRRWQQHETKTGAKYFRSTSPKFLVYLETQADRSKASKKEAFIKKLTKDQKLALIESEENQLENIPLPDWDLSY